MTSPEKLSTALTAYLGQPLAVEKWLDRYLDPGKGLVIFDIGACEAEDSIRYSVKFPNARIFSFEPLAENVQKAQHNIELAESKTIRLESLALSDEDGFAEFHVSSGHPEGFEKKEDWDFGNKSSSLLAPAKVQEVFSWLNFSEKRQVSTKRLDTYMRENGIELIDYIHMDVQGAELKVLQGAGPRIADIGMIWLEVEKKALYRDQPLQKDIERFLRAHNFEKIFEEMNSTAGDQLYINKRLHQEKSTVSRSSAPAWKRMLNRIGRGRAHAEYARKSYSQSGEDLIADYIFRTLGIENPAYLDIGAHHPYRLNNTAIFYERGSRGINVEPDPDLFREFTIHRPADINIQAGVGSKPSFSDFFQMSVPALNTFSEEEALRLQEKFGYTIVSRNKVELLPLSAIVERYPPGGFPEFLTVDVEGLDDDILKSIPFGESEPIVICVETISFEENGSGVKNRALIDFLASKGFMLYADTYINSLFVKEDRWKR